MGVVPLAARCDSLMAVAHGLARSQAGPANRRWDDKKYNQVELRNERLPHPQRDPDNTQDGDCASADAMQCQLAPLVAALPS